MTQSPLICSRCQVKPGDFIELVKHLRADHGLSLTDAVAEANRRKPQKTLAEAVQDHNRMYGIRG